MKQKMILPTTSNVFYVILCLNFLISFCFGINKLKLVKNNSTRRYSNQRLESNATFQSQTKYQPTQADINSLQISQILNEILENGYDKRVRPNYGGQPVQVNVTMRIIGVSSVSEVSMDFTTDFFFRQAWKDQRLSFEWAAGNFSGYLHLGELVSRKIWLPDTFFANEKAAYFHTATTPNVFLSIDKTGSVYRSIRLTVTSSCPMNLQFFPMDRQQCTIEAESYAYTIKDIVYKWARNESAVERDDTILLPQFDIVKTKQKYRSERLSSGHYVRLVAELYFARRMGYYLIQIFIPSSLIVVISWVSFWLHRNASPARVQLGVTTVLTMTTLMSSTNSALPKISYVKSIDIFLGMCFLMVFAALLEYATVGYIGKRIAMRRARANLERAHLVRLFSNLAAGGTLGACRNVEAGSDVNAESVFFGTNFNKQHPTKYTCKKTALEEEANAAAAAAAGADVQLFGTPPPSASYVAAAGSTSSQIPESFAFVQSILKHQQQQLLQQQHQLAMGARQQYSGPVPPPRTGCDHNFHQQLNECLANTNTTKDAEQTNIDVADLSAQLESMNRKLMKSKKLDSIFGVRSSDIDKYSRVFFPVCFICFQLMYWIVYLHISTYVEPMNGENTDDDETMVVN